MSFSVIFSSICNALRQKSKKKIPRKIIQHILMFTASFLQLNFLLLQVNSTFTRNHLARTATTIASSRWTAAGTCAGTARATTSWWSTPSVWTTSRSASTRATCTTKEWVLELMYKSGVVIVIVTWSVKRDFFDTITLTTQLSFV